MDLKTDIHHHSYPNVHMQVILRAHTLLQGSQNNDAARSLKPVSKLEIGVVTATKVWDVFHPTNC